MAKSARRARRVWFFLLVCALHCVLGWLLLSTTRVMSFHIQARNLELLLIAPTRTLPKWSSTVIPQPTRPGSVYRHKHPRVVTQEIDIESSTKSNAITPPVDWDAELAQEELAAPSLGPKSSVKYFGFPQGPPTMADFAQFDWDYARTHRVESLPEGGVIIHLNDNCVVVMNPIPFPFCSPFKRKANGELFKHMHDRDKLEDLSVP